MEPNSDRSFTAGEFLDWLDSLITHYQQWHGLQKSTITIEGIGINEHGSPFTLTQVWTLDYTMAKALGSPVCVYKSAELKAGFKRE